jgi:hypothetical protein
VVLEALPLEERLIACREHGLARAGGGCRDPRSG